MTASRKYALDFRPDETAYVMERWLAVQSCSLVGIGSVGKSNLLRHLATPEVQAHYMGAEKTERFKAIIIDPNLLGVLPAGAHMDEPVRAWAGYELLMHRLYLAFYPLSEVLGPDDARRFWDTYQALQDGNNPLYAYMSVRYFELGLEYFMRRGWHIVFMFDEFEALMRQMPVRFFQNLRGLRDSNKRYLSYLTFTRAPLPLLAQKYELPALDFEPFDELFTDSTYFVGPYNEQDAARMIGELSANSGKSIPDPLAWLLIRLTGGYAGLLRSAFSIIEPAQYDSIDDDTMNTMAQQKKKKNPIRSECRVIWSSLTEAEQALLQMMARGAAYHNRAEAGSAVNQLIHKRILRLDRQTQKVEIYPPIFRLYIASEGAKT